MLEVMVACVEVNAAEVTAKSTLDLAEVATVGLLAATARPMARQTGESDRDSRMTIGGDDTWAEARLAAAARRVEAAEARRRLGGL